MLWLPHDGDSKVITNAGLVGADIMGTSVPDGGTVNTYGTVTELISAASNTQDSWGIAVMACLTLSPNAIVDEASLDILIGGATDDVLISSLLIGGTFYGGGRSFFFPVHVPAGVRIAARVSAATLQTTEPCVSVWLYGGTSPLGRVGRKVTTYGTKINNSRGIAVTPSASGAAATETQIVAATTEDHFYFLPGFQVSTDATIASATGVNVGIGVGAATGERIGTWWFTKNASEVQSGPHPPMGVYRDVPVNSRLSLLISNGQANDAAHDGHVYAVS